MTLKIMSAAGLRLAFSLQNGEHDKQERANPVGVEVVNGKAMCIHAD